MTHPKIEELEAFIVRQRERCEYAAFAIEAFKGIEASLPPVLQVQDNESELNEDGLYRVDAAIGNDKGDDPFTACGLSLALIIPSDLDALPRVILSFACQGLREGEEGPNDEELRLEFSILVSDDCFVGIWKIKQDLDDGVPRSDPWVRFRKTTDFLEEAEREISETRARELTRAMIDFMVDELQHANSQSS